jgi:hypothetical protein
MAKEILICSLAVGLVALALFLFLSLDSLEYNNIGLNYSSYFKSVENKTYSSGFHFIGLGHDFISYDINIKTMEFSNGPKATLPSIKCRTQDGLPVGLEISFQYRVLPETIYEIYTEYGADMNPVLLRTAIDQISETATEFNAYDFFTKRTQISAEMKAKLDTRLRQDMYSEVVFFQLRSIDLPDDYELALQQTEVTKQDILKADAEKNKNNVTQQMRVEVASISQAVTINQATGAATSKKLKADSVAQTFLEIQTKQGQAYADVKKNLTFTNPELIQYMQINLIRNNPGGQLIVAINDK